VYTPPVKKYAIFDVAESRLFLAQNPSKSFVAWFRPDPLGELTALPQTTQLDLTVLLLREGRGGVDMGGKGTGDATHSLCKIPSYATGCNGLTSWSDERS